MSATGLHGFCVACGLWVWRIVTQAALRIVIGSGPSSPKPSDDAPTEEPPPGFETPAAQLERCPVNWLHLIAVMSQATLPLPYWVLSMSINADPLSTLVVLIELESLGIVTSRRLGDGAVLYALSGEKQWKETW